MSDNKYYKENFFKRSVKMVTDFFKSAPSMKFDATAGAIGFFVVLVAMLEYKVFESMYGMTGDIILTASTLLVTAFGGVYAEVVLRRNEDATDDQNMLADAVFYISLATSAFVGLGAWMQAVNIQVINLGGYSFSIPQFSQISIVIITIVTIADILILRAYFRGDVNAVHRRNVAQSNSKKKQADLTMEDKLIDFDVQVKTDAEQILRVERRRKEVRDELQGLYGGKVPQDVMAKAMGVLDTIMQEIKTGEDINGDKVIGMPMRPAFNAETQQPPKIVQQSPNSLAGDGKS